MTAGTTLAGGGALTANHLYLATIEGRGVKASTAVTLLVRGPTAFNKQKSGRHGIVPPVLLLLCLPNGPEGGNERRFLRRGDQIGGGSHFLIAAAVGV